MKILHPPDVDPAFAADHVAVLTTGMDQMDAQRAFARATRERRRAAIARRLRRSPRSCGQLRVLEPAAQAARPLGIREIPLKAIGGTLEPSRVSLFDADFRPSPAARGRWERVWLAEQRGAVLPPISVVAVADGYAITDGHHRVSVARARGALTIDATVDGR